MFQFVNESHALLVEHLQSTLGGLSLSYRKVSGKI